MARSSHIYLILDPIAKGPAAIVAAFTVKHECESWLWDCESPHKDRFIAGRVEDSPYEEAQWVPITFGPPPASRQ